MICGQAGNDTIDGKEGPDQIFGHEDDDAILGGPGTDTISAGLGNDTVADRDGEKDTIVCGPGDDTVAADPLDEVNADCEHVTRAPAVPTGGAGGGGGGGGGAGGGGGGAPDATRPAVRSASVSPKRVKAGRASTFSFTLSEAAQVTIAFARKAPGRKVGKHCAKPGRANRTKRRCSRYVKVGRLRTSGVAGVNRYRFGGKIAKKALEPGAYRVTLTATDAAGNRSAAPPIALTVKRR